MPSGTECDVLRIHSENHQTFGPEARGNILEVAEGANQQASTDQQHNAQCHLQRDNDFADADLAGIGIRSCRGCLKSQSRPGGKRNTQRRQSKQQRRQHQDAQCEGKDGVVWRKA